LWNYYSIIYNRLIFQYTYVVSVENWNYYGKVYDFGFCPIFKFNGYAVLYNSNVEWCDWSEFVKTIDRNGDLHGDILQCFLWNLVWKPTIIKGKDADIKFCFYLSKPRLGNANQYPMHWEIKRSAFKFMFANRTFVDSSWFK